MNSVYLEELYLRYQKEIYLYLYSLCKNREVAEDLRQDTFLKAILSLPEDHTNVRAWLYLVARNLYFNYSKKNSREDELDAAAGLSVDDDMLDGIIEGEKNKLLYMAMQKLPRQKREILILQYWGGLSQKEIASTLGITTENVRVSGYRGKKELKKILEENCYDIS